MAKATKKATKKTKKMPAKKANCCKGACK